jgi:signal recognition particle GTPase
MNMPSWGDEIYEETEGKFLRMTDKEWRSYCEQKLAKLRHEKMKRSRVFHEVVNWMDSIDYIRSDRWERTIKKNKGEFEDDFNQWLDLLYDNTKNEYAEELMEDLEEFLMETPIAWRIKKELYYFSKK